jgi:hypothetical protein
VELSYASLHVESNAVFEMSKICNWEVIDWISLSDARSGWQRTAPETNSCNRLRSSGLANPLGMDDLWQVWPSGLQFSVSKIDGVGELANIILRRSSPEVGKDIQDLQCTVAIHSHIGVEFGLMDFICKPD